MTDAEARNVANAKWTVLFNGNILPVTNLYDSDGSEIHNALRASHCVAFDELRDGDKWLVIILEPGELWSRTNE